MSTWTFVIITGYCHIDSQHGRVPTQVWARTLGSEGGVGRVGPNRMKMWSSMGPPNHIHPKLRNINLHNVKHSLISWNPRERMFVVQYSLFIVTFLSLIPRNLSLMQATKEVNPHPRIAPCVNMWSVFFFSFFSFLCHLLNVGTCVPPHRPERPGGVDHTSVLGDKKHIQIVLASPLCHFVMSHATLFL